MKILIVRVGRAYGDILIITPVIRYLHSEGHELYVQTGAPGMEILKNNPHIKHLIRHKDEIPIEKLAENIEWVRKKFGCEKVLDFSESVEVALSQHPRSPNYKLPKKERIARFNRNFYEYAFEHAKLACPDKHPVTNYNPELFFDDAELKEARKYLKLGNFNVLLGLSGSGRNKTWAYAQDFAYKVCEEYPDVHFITVGDELCRLIEPELKGRITNLCGKQSMRASMCMTGLVDLVIAPDTGLIHAAGCYETQKILLVGHNTRENISKHFVNCTTIEADVNEAPCAPCLFLIYNAKLQCPISEISHTSICMTEGMQLSRVLTAFSEIYAQSKKRI